MPKGSHLTGEAKIQRDNLELARQKVQYLPKGKLLVIDLDSPSFPVRFPTEVMRNNWLKTFYGNRYLLGKMWLAAKKLSFIPDEEGGTKINATRKRNKISSPRQTASGRVRQEVQGDKASGPENLDPRTTL